MRKNIAKLIELKEINLISRELSEIGNELTELCENLRDVVKEEIKKTDMKKEPDENQA